MLGFVFCITRYLGEGLGFRQRSISPKRGEARLSETSQGPLEHARSARRFSLSKTGLVA